MSRTALDEFGPLLSLSRQPRDFDQTRKVKVSTLGDDLLRGTPSASGRASIGRQGFDTDTAFGKSCHGIAAIQRAVNAQLRLHVLDPHESSLSLTAYDAEKES